MGRVVRPGGAEALAAEARRALAAARREAEALLQAARDEVLALQAAAKAEASRRAAEAREALAAGREEALARLRAEADAEVVPLALEVAARVLSCAVADGEAARETAGRALALARGARSAVLRVHPDDLEPVRQAGMALPGAEVVVRADPAVGRGGAVVETEEGVLDARLEAQLEAIGRCLAEEA